MKNIYITKFDKDRLHKLISDAKEYNLTKKEYIEKLNQELQRAFVVNSEKIPNDVITMNSQVSLKDLDTGEEMIYTLVFPEEADLVNGKISILAPIGTAILGYRVGDTIEWVVPNGLVKLKVEKIIYQPEAVGNYTL